MRLNELWTCPDNGAARAQAPGCQRSSCRRGRGGEPLGRGDLRLLRWVQTVPIYNDWTVIKHPPRSLRSPSCIRKEGMGCETSLANVGFSSKKFGSLAKNLP